MVNGIDIFSHLLGLRSFGLNNIDLSIVIVNYRSWQTLGNCLKSLTEFPPTFNHEIIVVDNDSQDGKLENFSRHHNVAFIINSGNNGYANGCNLGAENAQGKFLLFLNPDTVITSINTIDSMLEFANRNPNIGITSCRKISPKGKPEREMAFANPWLIISWIRAIYKLTNKKEVEKKFPKMDKVWHPDWVSGSVILIHSNLFNKIGRWNQESFWMYYEDVDLCIKVKNQNKNIALLRNVELQHTHGGSSRRNPKTTAITKSEVVTSSHVFIQIHAKGISRIVLHALITLDTLASFLLRTLLTLPVFWKRTFQSNLLTLIAIIKYYIGVIISGTWKSKKLITNEKNNSNCIM